MREITKLINEHVFGGGLAEHQGRRGKDRLGTGCAGGPQAVTLGNECRLDEAEMPLISYLLTGRALRQNNRICAVGSGLGEVSKVDHIGGYMLVRAAVIVTEGDRDQPAQTRC
jgi:hypothetical protein